MDPDVVSQLNEQIKQLNDMLSQQAVAMTSLANSMNSSAPAIKNAADATTKSTQAQDANTQSIGKINSGVTKLSDIQKKSNQVMHDAASNFAAAAGKTGSALRSFTDNLLSSEEGFGKYGTAMTSLGSAAFDLGKSFGPLGFIFGGILKVGSEVLSYQAKQADSLFKASDDIARLGAAGTFTVEEIRKMGAGAGLTSFELEKLITPMKSVQGGFAALGGTQSEGIKKFGELAAVSEDTRREFKRLGMGDQERNQALANYVTMMNKSGAAFSGNLKTQQGLQKAALNYTRNLYELAELTGKDVDTVAKERETQMATMEVALQQSKWEEDRIDAQKRKENAKTAEERAAAQADLDRIEKEKAGFEQYNNELEQAGLNAEMKAAAQQYYLTGVTTTQSAKFKLINVDLEKARAAAKENKLEKGSLAEEIKQGRQQTLDNIGQGTFAMAGDEFQKTFGLDQETVAKQNQLLKYNLKTEAGRAAAALEANKAGTGAAATDPAQKMRNDMIEAERKAKLYVDELAASLNPFLGNMGMLKVFGGILAVAAAGLVAIAAVKGIQGLLSFFKKGGTPSDLSGAASGASNLGGAAQVASVTEDQLLDKNGKPLTGAARDSRIRKLTGGHSAVIEPQKKGLSGALKGIANALGDAGKAAPNIMKGAGALAVAIAEFGAGIAGATWIMGKALPSLTSGLKSFKGVDGGNLVSVGLGMAGLGAGILAMGAGTIATAIGNLIEYFTGGNDPFADISSMLFTMSLIPLDPKRIKDNGSALLSFAKAMAAIAGLGALSGFGNAIKSVYDSIGSLFGGKTPFDELVEFSKLEIDADKTRNNSLAFRYFTDALASYKGMGSNLGAIGGAIAEASGRFFEATPPFDQFVAFSKLKIDSKKVKNNSTAFKYFAEALASYEGLGSPVGAIGTTLANASAKFFEVRPPLTEALYFSYLNINKKKTANNAKAFVLFSTAMASYKGGPGLLDAVSTIAGAKLNALFERDGPMESFKRFSEMKFGQNASKNADAFFKFAKGIAMLTDSGPGLLETAVKTGSNLVSKAGEAISAGAGAIMGAITGDYFKGDAGTQQGQEVRIGNEIRKGGTVSWRTNNPGNVSYGELSKKYGAVGRWIKPDGDKQQRTSGIAIMPTLAHGQQLKMALWRRPMYLDLDIDHGVSLWTLGTPTANLGTAYAKDMARAAGVPLTTRIRDLNDAQLKAMTIKQQKWEGFKEGTVSKAKTGGVFTGPKSGFPIEMHGTEMVIPMSSNSVLGKLAKSSTEVSNMTFSALRKVATKDDKSAHKEDPGFLNPEMIFELSKKFDNVIEVLEDHYATNHKILKRSMV